MAPATRWIKAVPMLKRSGPAAAFAQNVHLGNVFYP